MALDPLTTLSSISAELEHGWKLFDDIYNAFDAAQWQKKMSKNWVFAPLEQRRVRQAAPGLYRGGVAGDDAQRP
jgi:hypothetical protein